MTTPEIFCFAPEIDLFLAAGAVFVPPVSSLLSSVFIIILTRSTVSPGSRDMLQNFSLQQ